MKKILVIAAILLCQFIDLQAQITEYPLNSYRPKPSVTKYATQTQRSSSSVALPFIEDFSQGEGLPNPERWQQNGGVLISNNFCVSPPTLNAATFDGMDSIGRSYSNSNTEIGPIDFLTSLPIELGNLSTEEANSLYMSFFWQAGGASPIYEPSQSSDSLVLQFKSATGKWRTQWRRIPPAINRPFKQVILKIQPDSFAHNNFQFRFLAHGRRSGNYDIWHIDYVRLDKNRFAADTIMSDLALCQKPNSLLKKYWSVPFSHYEPSVHLNDTITTVLKNLKENIVAFSVDFKVKDELGAEIVSVPTGDANIQGSGSPALPNLEPRKLIVNGSNLSPLGTMQAPATWRYRFAIAQDLNSNPFAGNDTVSNFVTLQDYYAYDDGTPEINTEHKGNNAKVAWKFSIQKPDTITGISIYLPKFFPSGPQQATLKPRIWTQLKGVNGATQDVVKLNLPQRTIDYTSAIYDDFIFFDFRDSSADKRAVSGDIYIGWENGTAVGQNVRVVYGSDINTKQQNTWFVNTNGSWFSYNTLQPAGMVRAVFGSERPTSIRELKSAVPLQIFPNPTTSVSTVKTADNTAILGVEVYNLLGAKIQNIAVQNVSENEALVDVSNCSKGIYILLVQTEKGLARQKIVKE